MNNTPNEFPSQVSNEDIALLRQIPDLYRKISNELARRIIGQQEIIRDLFIALLARGHCLIVGVPGLAKTLLVRTLADVLDLEFRRIQFTPDLMPGDVTGSEILEENAEGGRTFRFVPGPLFTQFLLADEINRTPPKTQAALLEAMQEKRVTVAGQTYSLSQPFFVLATQNPIEQEGTYPLPEAQLDRFMFNIQIGYPSHEEEREIMIRTTADNDQRVEKVMTGTEILTLQHAICQIPIPTSVANFAVSLVRSTRPGTDSAPEIINHYVQWGAGPRAVQCLALAGKVQAAMDGRFNVAREDIVAAAKLVLRHRVLTNYRAEAGKVSVDNLIDQLIETMPW